jgi:hypothetical protein
VIAAMFSERRSSIVSSGGSGEKQGHLVFREEAERISFSRRSEDSDGEGGKRCQWSVHRC